MALSDILTGIDKFVSTEISAGETAVETWWTGFEPILEKDFAAFVNAMKPVALALVTGLAQAAISGQQKMSVASSALVATAKAQGIAATTTMANTLLQQVVTSLSMTAPPPAKP